jgi:rubrerythrin
MIIHTASEGITLARKLENESAQFYEGLAKKYAPDAETFLSFARENKKNIAQIERAYYGVITDAIEGGYAFNLDTDKYTLQTVISEKAKYADILKQAAAMEGQITGFYTEAAEQSRALMADVPRTFLLVVKKRDSRKAKLQELLGREGGK